VEATQVPINRCIGKQCGIHTHTHTHIQTKWNIFSHTKEGNPAVVTTSMEPEDTKPTDKSQREKRQIPHDFIKSKSKSKRKKQAHKYREQIGGCQRCVLGLGMGEPGEAGERKEQGTALEPRGFSSPASSCLESTDTHLC